MKTLIIPISEIKNHIFDFQPGKEFKTEWCLDLHGFLTRNGLNERLDRINFHIRDYPLMSEKTKTKLYLLSGIWATLIVVIAVVAFNASYANYESNIYSANSQPPDVNSAIAGTSIVEALIAALTFLARYLIDQKSKKLAKNFENNLKFLLTEYNNQDNPTANWRFVWRSVLSHFSVEANASLNGSIKGKAVPQYVEHAEILLEINDALSDLTANT
ncbi:6140_t:CDS:1, partial [Scutellospora calospora]